MTAPAWFRVLVEAVVTALDQPTSAARGVAVEANPEIELFEAGGREQGYFATVGTCARDRSVALDVWFDRYLGIDGGLRVSCWAMSEKARTIDVVRSRVSALWGEARTIGHRDRDRKSDLVNSRVADVIERDLTNPIIDRWPHQYYVGRYLRGGMDEPPHRSVGSVVTTIEQLAAFFGDGHAVASDTSADSRVAAADDERRRRMIEVLCRDAQPAFRARLWRHFGGTCLVTGCAVREALEAAHIVPVSANGSDSLENGLLLRSDLHGLFDAGLLRFEVVDAAVIVNFGASVWGFPEYAKLHLKRIPTATLKAQLEALRSLRRSGSAG